MTRVGKIKLQYVKRVMSMRGYWEPDIDVAIESVLDDICTVRSYSSEVERLSY